MNGVDTNRHRAGVNSVETTRSADLVIDGVRVLLSCGELL